MSLWSLGGYVLGYATALMGERMVWMCTEAVEATVHRHLADQLRFLEPRDKELYDLIASIQEPELAHLSDAQARQHGAGGTLHRFAFGLIGWLTGTMIWPSTWGDLCWMRPEMARAR